MKCKKCGRTMPDKAKSKICENCRGKRAQLLKDVGKGAAAVGALALSVVVTVITKGKK